MPRFDLSLTSLREKRAAIRARLDVVDALTRALSGEAGPEDVAGSVARIVSVLEREIRPYMEWEGGMLHPIIDKFACEGPAAFSASMQCEHDVVDRWIDDLAARAREVRPDPRAFARQTDRLLGLLAAHFEVEDKVFLPVLDRAFQAPTRGPRRSGSD